MQPYTRSKFEPRSTPCVFIGYASSSKGYKCYNLATSKVIVSRHVVFRENVFPFKKSSPQLPLPTSTPTLDNFPLLLTPASTIPPAHHPSIQFSNPPDFGRHSTHPASNTINPLITDVNVSTSQPSPPQIIPSSTHSSNNLVTSQPNPSTIQPISTHPMTTRSRTGSLKPTVIFDLHHSLSSPPDPTCYSSAVKLPQWCNAISEEFNALQQQGTWTLVPPPTHQSVLGCRWTYRTKFHDDDTIARHKARLVAQGHKQEYGIDYTDTFCPVAKITSIRVLITIASYHQWSVTQLDISNAFLHGLLNETVYMSQPIGFIDPQSPNHVCRLNKAIYGLKQSPR